MRRTRWELRTGVHWAVCLLSITVAGLHECFLTLVSQVKVVILELKQKVALAPIRADHASRAGAETAEACGSGWTDKTFFAHSRESAGILSVPFHNVFSTSRGTL